MTVTINGFPIHKARYVEISADHVIWLFDDYHTIEWKDAGAVEWKAVQMEVTPDV